MPGDTNGASDIFVFDLQTSAIERGSVDSFGNQATNDDPLLGAWLASSFFPAISSGGRYVTFTSNASTLVPGDTNGVADIFIHDRETGQTHRVSVDSTGNEANESSYDTPAISSDGRFVAFRSFASNLVPDDTNSCIDPEPHSCADIFVHDRQTSLTYRASISTDGVQGNQGSDESSISTDGQSVAFSSFADNLVTGDTATCLPPPHATSCDDIFVQQGLSTPAAPTPSATPVAVPIATPVPVALPQTGEHVDHENHALLPAAMTLGVLLLAGLGLQLTIARMRGNHRH